MAHLQYFPTKGNMKIVYLSIIVLIIDILMIRRKAFGYAMGLGQLFLLSA